jgi:pyrroline-5-carboxylate reductase
MLGCGNMGGAMLRGWIQAGLDPATVTVIKPTSRGVPEQVAHVSSAPADEPPPRILVLGVKPQLLDVAAPLVSSAVGRNTLVVSMLAGIDLAALRLRFPAAAAVIRVMPNTPAALGRGVLLLQSESLDPGSRAIIDALMQPLGLVEWVDDPVRFEAATALSGCGPAFVFRFIDALANAGMALGLPAEQAARLALATVEGATALAADANEAPAILAERVASPGGMTREGLNILDANHALGGLLVDTLAAAMRRGQELAAAARR